AQALGRNVSFLAISDKSGALPFWRGEHLGSPSEFDAKMTVKSGDVIDVTVCASRLVGGDADGGGVCAIIRDLTVHRRQKQQDDLVMRELSHRAKNNLAVISAIARNTVNSSASVEDYEAKLSSRIRSLANSHDALIQLNWRGAELHPLIRCQLHPFCNGKFDRCDIAGPEIILKPQATQMIGIAMHELAANAVSYGAWSNASGRIEVSWALETLNDGAGVVHLEWVEKGGPPITQSQIQGFGRLVVETLTPDLLDSVANLAFENAGVRWKVRIPDSHFDAAGLAAKH
ncbi:MAG: HWE histidine kinase domain-containing protein, partial [Hyphomicrobium sp.]